MSSFKLKAVPAALLAAGMLAHGVSLADGLEGIPPAIQGVYAQGTFSPTAYMTISRGMYATDPTLGATHTGGYIMLLLKPAQTAWGYAFTTGSAGDTASGTATLSHTLTTGTKTCTAVYSAAWDAKGYVTLSNASVASSATKSADSVSCRTAFINQTNLAGDFYAHPDGTAGGVKTFTLIY